MDESPHFPILSLSIADNALMAYLAPSDAASPVQMEDLKRALADRHIDHFDLDGAAEALLLLAAHCNESFQVKLAKVQFSELTLALSTDAMHVTAESKPSQEGEKLDVKGVEAALLELGVVPDLVDRSAIERLLASGGPINVALGREANHGVDSSFEATFGLDNGKEPSIDEHDIADYYQTKSYVTVEVGDVLMRRRVSTSGDDGTTVLGKVIKANKGKLKRFKKYTGSEVSLDDENALLAKLKGHPVLEVEGVRVDETLSRPHASLDSGNIEFDGSVVILGDVFPQVHIIASGDIFVKGTVENAHLHAGNNIVIGGGVISESIPFSDEPPKITTTLKAGGDVHAKFLNQTSVVAGKNVLIQSYVLNSELEVEESLVVGEKGGKGSLIGGKTFVGLNATMNILGSTAYLLTVVNCGRAHELKKDLASISRLGERRAMERGKLEQILIKIQDELAPKVGAVTLNRRVRITKVIETIETQLEQVKNKQVELTERLEKAETAFVQVNRFLYPKVKILVNGEPYLEQSERTRTKISVKNGEIILT